MVDLVALASLFADVFGAAKEWTEPKIARLDPLDVAEQEPLVRALRAKGHKLEWLPEIKLRQLKREPYRAAHDLYGSLRRTRAGPSSSAKGSINALGPFGSQAAHR
jgi:hypothetical protein